MIKNYLKIALRNLWRHRNFSLLNIGGLAIGMTAGFLIFLYVSYELSYDRFHSEGDRIYRLVTDIKTPTETSNTSKTAWAFAPHLKKEFPEIKHAVRIYNLDMLVRRGNTNFMEDRSLSADSAFFKVFDFKLLQGNKKTCLKEPLSIVLSKTAAKKYFGQKDPMGKTLKVFEDGYPATVTGIMEDIPENSHIKADVILSSTSVQKTNSEADVDNQWGNFAPSTYLLLRKGTNPSLLQKKFPGFIEKNIGKDNMQESQMYFTLLLEPLKKVHLWSDRESEDKGNINNVYLFAVIAVFILLIACINFVNLTTARSVERAKEVGIRKVIGAEKRQLIVQFIGESLIISMLSFLITLGLIALLLPYFNQLSGKIISSDFAFSTLPVVTFFIAAVLIGIFAGIYPALVLSSYKPAGVLKGRFAGASGGILLRKTLVISQFVISIGLITGTIIIYNQMDFMQEQDLGFKKEQMLVLNMNTGINSSQKALQQALENIPGIASTSFTSAVPGWEHNIAYSQMENRNGDLQKSNLGVYFIDFDFIRQFDLEVIAGRPFSREFATDSTQAMVLNEKAVKSLGYSNPEDVLGKRFEQWGREGKVIGVVRDFNFTSLQNEIRPLSFRIEPTRTNFMAVSLPSENIRQTLKTIKGKWNELFPQKPFDYFFMDEFFDRQYRSEQRFGKLFLNFAVLAILISCLGLLGLASYSTLQRRREIGIRKVVGASVPGIVNLLSKEFVKLVGIAFLIASPLVWFGMRQWLKNFAYRIDLKWWVFVIGGGIALFIALATVSFQAVKAAVANPVKSLKTE